MNILLPDKPDILEPDEVYRLTERKHAREQIRWLEQNDWQFTTNASGKPIVSRLYLQIQLAGIGPESVKPQKACELDMDTIG